MALFKYLVKNRDGKEDSGTLEADTKADAARELRSRQVLILSLADIEEEAVIQNQSAGNSWKEYLPITSKDRSFFYRQLAIMVRSGLTLMDALSLMEKEFPNVKMRRCIGEVLNDVRAGLSFSQALERHEKVFTHLGVKVVETTEASGEMETGLLKISSHIEFWSELSKKVMSALAYPLIILFMSFGVGAFLVVKIIPKFDDYMQKRGIIMPWATALVINFSRFFSEYWLVLLIFILASAAAFLFAFRNSKGRRVIEHIVMKIPIMGNVFRYACLTNFTSTLAVLLKSGLGLIESLQLTSELLGISVYKNAVKSSAQQVIQGISFKNSLQTPLFPRMVTNIVSVGEETGELNTVLDELGDFYSNELKRTVEIIVTAIEPAMMICVGGVVAVVYFALFQAVMSLMGA